MLPVYISSMTRNGKLIGYQVEDIKTGKRRVFTSSKQSMQQKLQSAELWLENTKAGVTQDRYKKARRRVEDDHLPIGVYYTCGLRHGKPSEGYLVQARSGRKAREFCKSSLTLEEKKVAALAYVGDAARY